MKTKPKTRRLAFLFILALVIFLSGNSILSAAEKAARVAVIPFKINAEKDLTFLRNGIVDMLTSRLTWENKVMVVSRVEMETVLEPAAGVLSESQARQIAGRVNADYVLFGSLTVFGNSVSIDAKMSDVSGSKPTLAFFNQSQGMDEVIPRINVFAEEINEKVFGRQIAVRPLPAREVPQGPSIYAHPERQFAEGFYGRGDKEGELSPFVMSRGAGGAPDFWKSQNFKVELKGIALGDVDGDGKIETVLLSDQQILVYRAEAGRFSKIKEISGEKQQDFVSVDVADIKKDGRAEIFVTCVDASSNSLDSFVLEWNGTDFVRVASRENWYYRVITHPERGALLLGQKRGVGEVFFPGVFELSWNGREYESQGKVPLPKETNIYDFALGDVMNTGREMVVTLDSDDRLRIFTHSGDREWKGDDHYGGSETYLKQTSGSLAANDDSEKRIYLAQRIFVTDLNQDGKAEVVLVKNEAITGRLFKRFRQYSGGQFESLSWDGLGLAENWHTRKVTGYISDYAIGDMDNDGEPDLVATVVNRREAIIQDARCAVIAYKLGPLIRRK